LLSSGEIGQVLKARVTDTNKAVQVLALDIISKIAIGMGKPFERQSRFFVLPVATVLADQKAPIRTAAILYCSGVRGVGFYGSWTEYCLGNIKPNAKIIFVALACRLV
jgi:hypothetical protein